MRYVSSNSGIWLGCALQLALGCANEIQGTGSLTIEISGEEAALSGYPVGSGASEIAFADGWTLDFRKVLVSLSHFELKTAGGDDADLESDSVVADLHPGDAELWRFDEVPARRWDRVGYRYQPPSDGTRRVGGASQADVALMRDEGYSFYIEGTARKGEREVEIAWGFPFAVQLSRCQNGLDETDGVVVRENAQSSAQITVHLDHLFFDNWAVDEPNLRFDAMAAVAPADGPLLLSDLAKQNNLSDLKAADGQPLDLAYDPGSAFSPVPTNLEQYTIEAATTTGHWNGEGHCDYAHQ